MSGSRPNLAPEPVASLACVVATLPPTATRRARFRVVISTALHDLAKESIPWQRYFMASTRRASDNGSTPAKCRENPDAREIELHETWFSSKRFVR
jgi:hypothetical protein